MRLKFYKILGQKIRPIELGLILKNIFRIKRRVYHFEDLVFFIDPVSNFGIRIMQDGYYEKKNTRTINELLSAGDTFIDIGANEGYFSILASKIVSKRGKVISIEPQRRLWPVIAQNIMLNDCINIQLLPFAVGEKNEDINIILTPSTNTGSSTLISNNRNILWKRQGSKTKRLDHIVEFLNIDKIRLVKVDVEGFEFFVIKSGERLLEKGIIENLLIEFHASMLKKFDVTETDIVNYLSNLGYSRSTVNEELFVKRNIE
jgi:FkbM family methyltransferase